MASIREILTTAFLVATLAASGWFSDAQAVTFKVLYHFGGGYDGSLPLGGVVEDANGNLFGTTQNGGFSADGTVYKLTSTGHETIVHAFTGDGIGPYGGLVADSAGNFYGTTLHGGNITTDCPKGCGTVFKIRSNGTETVLYAFNGLSDGANPQAGLTIDGARNLYGTTVYGGGSSNCMGGCGTVFRIRPNGTEVQLHAFDGGSDGAQPYAELYRDSVGNLYGTASAGGNATNCDGGCGVVFKLNPAGGEIILHRFFGKLDGFQPFGGLTADGSGNLYGTTAGGGGAGNCISGCGTVFKMDLATRKLTKLYAFTGGGDGGGPTGTPLMDETGNLYGGTQVGGGGGAGVVYRISPAGTEVVLHTFSGGSDGNLPIGNLIRDAAGNIFGAAAAGGSKTNCALGCGTVFEISN